MSRAKIIDHYIEKSKEPGFEIDQIRKELEPRNIPEEEIRIIVRLVDNTMQKQITNKSDHSKNNELIWVGAFLTIFGAGITIGTYTGTIDIGNNVLIVYGPFFGGLSLLFGGWAKKF